MITKKKMRAQDRAVNASKFRGVSLHKRTNRFQCYIRDDEEKKVHIGVFDKVKKHQFMHILCSWQCLDTLYIDH